MKEFLDLEKSFRPLVFELFEYFGYDIQQLHIDEKGVVLEADSNE